MRFTTCFATTVALLSLGTAAPCSEIEAPAARLVPMDGNQDGKISRGEIMRARLDVFNRFDGNGDGLLDPGEFAALQAASDLLGRGGAQLNAPEDPFAAADTDGDGSVSLDEFAARADAFARRMDADRDGIVTPADAARLHGDDG